MATISAPPGQPTIVYSPDPKQSATMMSKRAPKNMSKQPTIYVFKSDELTVMEREKLKEMVKQEILRYKEIVKQRY